MWVAGGLFVGLLVCLILGTRYTIRRYRVRKGGYNKVDDGAGIPLNGLPYRDDSVGSHHG